MDDFLLFTPGAHLVMASGLPDTCYFLLSEKSVGEESAAPFDPDDVLATDSGEIAGTGYGRLSEARPTPADRAAAFAVKTWETEDAEDWSSVVRSLVMATTENDSGIMVCAWNLRPGGLARDLSGANTTESVTPTFALPLPE